jgi:hypothetical protein
MLIKGSVFHSVSYFQFYSYFDNMLKWSLLRLNNHFAQIMKKKTKNKKTKKKTFSMLSLISMHSWICKLWGNIKLITWKVKKSSWNAKGNTFGSPGIFNNRHYVKLLDKHMTILQTNVKESYKSYIYFYLPVRIRERIGLPHPHACRMKPEKPRSRVTAGVAR